MLEDHYKTISSISFPIFVKQYQSLDQDSI